MSFSNVSGDLYNKSKEELIEIIKNNSSTFSQEANASVRNYLPKNFTPRILLPHTKHLIIGTSRVRDIYARQIAFNCMVHTYSGATLSDIADVIEKYDGKALSSVTIIGGFNDVAQNIDDSSFKELWEKVTTVIVSKFSPISIILPDTIPTTKSSHSARIDLIQASLHSYILDYPMVGKSKLYNPTLNAMFHITKETVGSAYFTRDGIHLSAIGTNMVTSFLTGFIRSLHTLSQDDKKEMHDIKQRHHNQRPQHQNHQNFQNSRLPNGPTRSYPNRNTGQNANNFNYQHPNRNSNRYGEQFQN